jgi:uncharacterized protein (DUF2235 family)
MAVKAEVHGLRLDTPHVRSWMQRLSGAPETHSNAARVGARGGSPSPKRIVICADGTWNTPQQVKAGVSAPTNVWLLYQLVKDRGGDGMVQLKYYHAGVGTVGDWFQRARGGLSGHGLDWNMLDCYRFLVEHYNPGDHVYLFGFSRGAYTVRTLAGLVRNSGIICRTKHPDPKERDRMIAKAHELYRERDEASSPVASRAVDFRAEHSHDDFVIACIGVWDTVGALGIPVDKLVRKSRILWWRQKRYQFHDVTLSAYVDCAFHALAIDEERESFKPTLWVQQPHAARAGQVLKQVWFSGDHCDVGGGHPWEERGLANRTLLWMVDQVRDHLRLDVDRVPVEQLETRDDDVTIHDSMSLLYRALNRVRLTAPFERIIDGGLGKKGLRDVGRRTTEQLDEFVEKLLDRDSERFPPRRRPYHPSNVKDFRDRLKDVKPDPREPEHRRDRKAPRAEAPPAEGPRA